MVALVILCISGNVAFFSVGIGPICGVLASEIFPLRLRAQASALGSMVNRFCSGFISMTFLSLSAKITVGGTFFFFSALSALSVLFVHNIVPETKGKSLEQVELLFQDEAQRKVIKMEIGDGAAFEHLVQNE